MMHESFVHHPDWRADYTQGTRRAQSDRWGWGGDGGAPVAPDFLHADPVAAPRV